MKVLAFEACRHQPTEAAMTTKHLVPLDLGHVV